MGLEGILSKRQGAAYVSGRSRNWLKSKCTGRDEFVIGGWRPSKVGGRPFSSLLVGEFQNGALIYSGRVGAGFDDADMRALARAFDALRRDKPASSVETRPMTISNDTIEMSGVRLTSPDKVFSSAGSVCIINAPRTAWFCFADACRPMEPGLR